MKTCKNCIYYTGIQCHGHGEYYGECKKNRNDLLCYDDTPCLQNVKTLRELYFKQKEKLDKYELESYSTETWKTRYEIKCRHLQKLENFLNIAHKYIPKENYKDYSNEILEYLKQN